MRDSTLLVMNLVLPVLLIGLSLPLIYGKVPPNHWYGFRTPKTLSSDAMWYRTNRVGGQYLVIAAILEFTGALALAGFRAPLVIWQVLMTVPLLIAIAAWFWRIRNW